jgi:hypothetical protein
MPAIIGYMMKGNIMTIDQIRAALIHMEHNYDLAISAHEHGLANAFHAKIDWLWSELIRLVKAEDPNINEADITFFGGAK